MMPESHPLITIKSILFIPFSLTHLISKAHSFHLLPLPIVHHTFSIQCPLQNTFFPTKYPPSKSSLFNVYDDWRSDAVVDVMHLDEDNIEMCLQELIDSEYGKQMFGKHERPSEIPQLSFFFFFVLKLFHIV